MYVMLLSWARRPLFDCGGQINGLDAANAVIWHSRQYIDFAFFNATRSHVTFCVMVVILWLPISSVRSSVVASLLA